MNKNNLKFDRRAQRVRSSIRKNSRGKIRLSVFRSNQHIYAQLIDDIKGITLASASTVDKEIAAKLKKTSNRDAAEVVGKLIAERGVKAKVSEVVFDRGGYLFHGRIKALADSARKAGLKF